MDISDFQLLIFNFEGSAQNPNTTGRTVKIIQLLFFNLSCLVILVKFGDFVKFYGNIPDILVLITGHFGLFKTPTLKLREAGKTQTPSQKPRLNISKTNFKSVRKTIFFSKKLSKVEKIYP